MDTTAPSDTAIKKIPTARQVGAVLRAAGFEASQSYPTRIRGFRNHTRGYSTRTYLPVNGCPVVSHVCGDMTSNDREERLDRYEEALRARFTVERKDGKIVVTGFLP
jgi:hypothetical protein